MGDGRTFIDVMPFSHPVSDKRLQIPIVWDNFLPESQTAFDKAMKQHKKNIDKYLQDLAKWEAEKDKEKKRTSTSKGKDKPSVKCLWRCFPKHPI